MFKKSLVALTLLSSVIGSTSALASNSEYGLISEIRYNSPDDLNGASMVVYLEPDPQGFSNSSEYESCYSDGVEGWYINLNSNPIVVETMIQRLREAERERTVVRLFGDDAACNTGTNQINDTIMEAYFYRE